MKIEEQVLSREQMKHLQELGVDTSDASMAYYNTSRDNQSDKWILGIANIKVASVMLSNGITEMEPAYTTGDLIEKLPKNIDGSNLLIEFCASDLGYGDWDCGELYGINAQQKFNDKSLKEALYDLLCWVAEKHKELLEVRNDKRRTIKISII